MKILTVAGTRPELIRLSVLINKLDGVVDHIFIYTNQNYDYNLSGKFFDELKIRKPDYYFTNEGHSIGTFLSSAIIQFERVLLKEKPDKVLLLGDTNSGLLSIIAEKYNIPVYHMEAGNRCYDERLPEETNRRIIDHVSKYNLPYTDNSKQNLLAEGFHKNFVFKIGNPINEVIQSYINEIDNSDILNKLGLGYRDFVLVTAHRTENVDNKESLLGIVSALNIISKQMKVIFSVHPRTKDKIDKFKITVADGVLMSEPFGFFDFIKLEQSAKVIISDSGTCQEEACLFNVPSITIRESTERQETIECGSNILVGTDTAQIVNVFNVIKDRTYFWVPPEDYTKDDVSDTVINILLGK